MRRNIILLNGPSSAGKSTLSGELQKRVKAHGYDLCIDNGKASAADNAEKILAEVYV